MIAFAYYLKQRVKNDIIRNDYLIETLDYEMSINKLRYLPRNRITELLLNRLTIGSDYPKIYLHPLIKLVEFRHDPEVLLSMLADMLPLPYHIPETRCFVLLDATSSDLDARKINFELGDILLYIENHPQTSINSSEMQILIDSNLIIYEEDYRNLIQQIPALESFINPL